MLDKLREKASRLPLLPGVYLMKQADGAVIYVGKAKALKNRVSSYFHGEHHPKVSLMVRKVHDFDVIVASSEFEALVLESSLIKRHRPQYNILLKDDKGYPYIMLDVKSEYPTFKLANKSAKDGARYFGPFGSRGVSKNIIDTVNKALLLPRCSRKFPRDLGKGRPCLNKHMGSCAGWCTGELDREEYISATMRAQMILSGKAEELKSELTEQMMLASEELRFEIAAELRDRLRAVESLAQKQRVISAVYADTDAVGFYRGARSCFSVLHYVNGDLAAVDKELTEEPFEEDAEVLSGLLRQYYGNRGTWPKYILLQTMPEDAEQLSEYLTESAGYKVHIEVPQRGDKLRLVEAALMNAREESERAANATQKSLKTLEWLRDMLGMEEMPERIEAFDVSNLGMEGVVAAMTVHVRGKPLKNAYKKFKIKTVEGADDYASMYEAVYRRYARLKDGSQGFENAPNLLLIDGGAGQVKAAERALSELELEIPTYGMVKDKRHRTRELVNSQGALIGLESKPAVFAYVAGIQEETHRFAIEYQRSLRTEKLKSGLQDVSGVGEKRRNDLLVHFKTVKAIKAASIEELREVLPQNVAQAVYDSYRKGGTRDESNNG